MKLNHICQLPGNTIKFKEVKAQTDVKAHRNLPERQHNRSHKQFSTMFENLKKGTFRFSTVGDPLLSLMLCWVPVFYTF